MDKERICRLRDIQRAIKQLDEDFETKFGIGLNEAMLLCTLNERGASSAGELSSELGLSRSNMSKVLSNVERRRYVERKISDTDKRVMIFSLTKAGKSCIEGIDCGSLQIPDQIVGFLGW